MTPSKTKLSFCHSVIGQDSETGQGTGHCPAGIFKNIISNVTKNEEEGHGPVPCPSARLVVE